jgi:hypothetical protein
VYAAAGAGPGSGAPADRRRLRLAGLVVVLVGLDQAVQDPGQVADVDTAMGWFRSDTFKEATKLAKVTSRRFYLAQPQT